MSRPVVSFCIATFQRYEILEELVREILSVHTDKVEVVVCDDKSLDGSIEKIKKIEDNRLKIYVNEENVGSSLNIHESLDKGNGMYLFYVNDRDNVDKFKIEKLVEILETLEKEEVAFAKCHVTGGNAEKYHIFDKGEKSLFQFACKIDHPTGYIFKRDIWKKIENKRILFENQNYGDYPITQVCAIMARNHKGALIYGDICELKRRRVDFGKVKSGYYRKRKDKRLWYTPEVIFRELKIGQKFLKKIGVGEKLREQIFLERYIEYLSWCVTGYKDKIADPVCTAHYNFYPRQDFFHVFAVSILNGMKLWGRVRLSCMADSGQLSAQINQISRKEYVRYFKSVWREKAHILGKIANEYEKKDGEIYKREGVLRTYESWMDAVIDRKMISDYLFAKGYHHVAIYGMGRIGKHLWKEFQNSNIQVDYIIDRQISEKTQYYGNVRCYNIHSKLPYVDLMIVTIPGEAEYIIAELRKKISWEIKTVDDILFVVD